MPKTYKTIPVTEYAPGFILGEWFTQQCDDMFARSRFCSRECLMQMCIQAKADGYTLSGLRAFDSEDFFSMAYLQFGSGIIQ